jgi:hypothetical protein
MVSGQLQAPVDSPRENTLVSNGQWAGWAPETVQTLCSYRFLESNHNFSVAQPVRCLVAIPAYLCSLSQHAGSASFVIAGDILQCRQTECLAGKGQFWVLWDGGASTHVHSQECFVACSLQLNTRLNFMSTP